MQARCSLSPFFLQSKFVAIPIPPFRGQVTDLGEGDEQEECD